MPSRQINDISQKGNKKIELVARPGHDPHADSHVGRVRQLNAVLGEGTAHWAHAEGYQVHCAPWNKNPPQEFSALIIFAWLDLSFNFILLKTQGTTYLCSGLGKSST